MITIPPSLRLVLPLASLLLLFTVGACDSVDSAADTDLDTIDLSAVATGLAEDLSLSKTSSEALQTVMVRHQPATKQPGYLWSLAAELQQKLTAEEKAKLFQKLDRNAWHPFGVQHKLMFLNTLHEAYLPRFVHLLALTEDQKARIKEIELTYAPDFKKLRDDLRAGAITPEVFHQLAEELRGMVRDLIHDVLTEEQKAKLEELLERANEKAEDRKDLIIERREAAFGVMVDVLDLTNAQVAGLKSLQAELKEQRKALFAQYRSGAITRTALAESLKALHEQTQKQMETLINDPVKWEIVLIHRALSIRLAYHRWHKDGFKMAR